MNVLEFKKDEDIFTYFDVQNLSIDHPLTQDDIEEYKDLIFSPNSLHQIYFKDECDVKSIQLIKNLLTISDYVDDSLIDKIVLLKLTDEELKTLLSDKYENPDTWSLPYEEENDMFSLADLPRLRTLKSFVKKIQVNDLSPLEKVMKVYDVVKLMDFDNNIEEEQLPDIVKNKKAGSNGFNKLFSYILDNMGFKTFTGRVKSSEGKTYYVSLVEIHDKNYNVDGIYLFDPSMDTLPKDKYDKVEVRRVNYNFFGLSLSSMTKLSYDDRLDGILSILAVDDVDYSCEKIENTKNSELIKEKERLERSFNSSYRDVHNSIKRSRNIDIDTIIEINNKLYNNKIDNYDLLLEDNYETRKSELFSKDTREVLEELIESEKKASK